MTHKSCFYLIIVITSNNNNSFNFYIAQFPYKLEAIHVNRKQSITNSLKSNINEQMCACEKIPKETKQSLVHIITL